MLTEQQLQIRKKGIGASEVATLFNLNEYSTPYQLWMEKTGRSYHQEETDPMWWGSNLEEVIIKRYQKETGKSVTIDKETKYRANGKYSKYSPYMLCHLDGIIEDEKRLLEVKISRYAPSKWGAKGTSECPRNYQLQCQHQLGCMPGYQGVELVVFFYQTLSIQIYKIERNNDLIDKIGNAVDKFWNEHVLTDIAPELWTIEDVKLAYPINNDKFVEATPIEIETYNKLKDTSKKIKKLEEEELKYKTDLIMLTGGSSGITNNGDILCTYKTDKRGNRQFKLKGM